MKKFLILSFLRLFALLPFRVLYYVSDVIGWLLDHVLHYRRQVIYDNLRRSFPEKSDEEINAIMREYYRHMGDIMVETIKLLHMSDRQLDKHIDVRNPDLVEMLASDGRSIVCFLGHFGNWEWLQEVCRRYKRPQYTCEIYQPLRDHAMDGVMHRIRSRWDTTLIPSKQAMRHLLGLHRDGTQFLCGFIADQRPKGVQSHWTTFLHQDTAFVTGGEDIGRHIHAHFVYLDVEKTRRGHYVLTFQKIVPTDREQEQPYPYTMAYMRMMQQRIEQQPAYWLWSHKRWKYKKKV